MNVRSRTVRTLATLSLGLLLLPAASFAKSSSSSSSSSHSSSSSSSSSKSSSPTTPVTSHTTTPSATSGARTINLSKASPPPKVSTTTTGAPGTINLAKPAQAVGTPRPSVATAATTPPRTVPVAPVLAAAPSVTVKAPVVVKGSPTPRTVVSSTNAGNWFGGHYEVFDRPGVNATRLYRSDSAFSTARWLMDHKAYRTPQVVNAGYELRTSGQVLDQGTSAFDRWIEQNR